MKKIFLPLIAASVLAVGADINALQKECDGGNVVSCYELGVLYDNAREGAAQDYQKAAELYSKACELGSGSGCSNLGFAYANGRGVKQDYAKASEFYAKACDMGNGGGCYNLGNLYAQGRGVKEDKNAAEKYLKKACDMEPELACDRYKEFIQR